MKLPFPAALAAAVALGAALPVLAQDAQAPVATPQTAAPTVTPADPQATTPPAVLRPSGSRGDCAWKSKALTS